MALLPVNVDSTYADSGADASVALHQQHHDQVHGVVNGNGGRWPSGAYLQPDGFNLFASLLTSNRCYYVPLWVPEARTTATIEVDMTVVASGGTPVFRMGLFSPDANGRPGSLLVDGGTTSATVTPAMVPVSVSQALPIGLVWVAIAAQGGATTQATLRMLNGVSKYVNLTTSGSATSRSGYAETVSGALPASATPTLTSSILAPFVQLKAA